MAALQNLSIQNCTGLTADIDLTSNSNLTQVDASGTTINVLVSEGTDITKYEVGTPTSISLVNPTALGPSGINVDHYGNIDSLVIKNMPNNKTYATFNKIVNTV